jgi:hypothetical protein
LIVTVLTQGFDLYAGQNEPAVNTTLKSSGATLKFHHITLFSKGQT